MDKKFLETRLEVLYKKGDWSGVKATLDILEYLRRKEEKETKK